MAQTLAEMREKKDVSLVVIGEGLQRSSQELELLQKDHGEHSAKAARNLGEYIVTQPLKATPARPAAG